MSMFLICVIHTALRIKGNRKTMPSYQDIPPPNSGRIYQNVRECTSFLVNALSSIVLERITSHLILQDSFSFSVFFKEAEVQVNSEEYHVFMSDHYRAEIFNRVERELRKEGYDCTLSLDESGRYKKISYQATVIHPLKRALRIVYPLIPIAIAYGGRCMYNYIMSSHEQE